MEELEDLDGGRSGADVHGGELIEPEVGPETAEHLLLHRRRRGLDLGRDLLAGLLEPHLGDRRLKALLGRFALLVGQAREHRLEPGLELLPDARNGEEPGRPDGRQEAR